MSQRPSWCEGRPGAGQLDRRTLDWSRPGTGRGWVKAVTRGQKTKTFLWGKGGIWCLAGGGDEGAMGKSCRPGLHKLLIKTRASVGELSSNSRVVTNWH